MDSSMWIKVFYACVNPTTKALTLSSSTATCPSGGSKIHWNQIGPSGLSHGYASDIGNSTLTDTVDGPRLPVPTPPGHCIVIAEIYDPNGAGTECHIQDTDGAISSIADIANPQQSTVITAALTIPPTASSNDTLIVRCGANVYGALTAVGVNSLN
jgi:hypothetical protein